MNLEEAKANIGKEVVIDESTKPYALNSGEQLSENAIIEINKSFKLKLSKVDKDGDVKIPCTVYGLIEKDKVRSLTQSMADKISHPRSSNLVSFESTISFETLNGVKIVEQKIEDLNQILNGQ